jgi:predicted aminopeptidase
VYTITFSPSKFFGAVKSLTFDEVEHPKSIVKNDNAVNKVFIIFLL